MRRIAGAAVMASIMALSFVAAATAHTVKYDSQVKLNHNGASNTFRGEVEAGPDQCESGREIEIYRVVEGGPDELVVLTTTNGNGQYSVIAPEEGGTFYAVVKRKVLRSDAEHTHVCARDRSPERTIS